MKYTLIKETDKIKLISAKDIKHYRDFGQLIKPCKKLVPPQDITIERDIIKTKIFTDGQIKGITPLDSSLLNLPKKLSKVEFDKVELSELELLNHNYVIRILTALEFRRFERFCGLFDVIKDIEIYIRDKKDKETLRNIKRTLELVCSKREYSSVFDMFLSPNQVQNKILYNKEKEGIYQLVKQKRK